MNPGDLVRAVLAGDDLAARQWVKDARRCKLDLSTLPEPRELDDTGRAVAAALMDLLASRSGQLPPPWVVSAGRAPDAVFLLPRAKRSAALRRWCEQDSPDALRRRNVFAIRDFLDVL
jgi:hypothetical protein